MGDRPRFSRGSGLLKTVVCPLFSSKIKLLGQGFRGNRGLSPILKPPALGRPSASSLRPYSCSKVQVMDVSSATCRPDGNANGWTLGTRVGKSGWGHGDGAVAVVKAAKVNRAALFCKTPLWFFCVAWRVPKSGTSKCRRYTQWLHLWSDCCCFFISPQAVLHVEV